MQMEINPNSVVENLAEKLKDALLQLSIKEVALDTLGKENRELVEKIKELEEKNS